MHAGRVLLGELTWTDLDGRALTLVVPIGSVEQHGPHLPLDVDVRVADAVALQEDMELNTENAATVCSTMGWPTSWRWKKSACAPPS